jgi:hypothetical protein
MSQSSRGLYHHHRPNRASTLTAITLDKEKLILIIDRSRDIDDGIIMAVRHILTWAGFAVVYLPMMRTMMNEYQKRRRSRRYYEIY